jgi:transglutaminase/protease-like cytokinesis protein 3
MKNTCLISFVFFSLLTTQIAAQNNYAKADTHALKVGKLDSTNMGSITTILTKPFAEKADKARAIYTWIANNIVYDLKAIRASRNDKDATADVLLYRKATAEGFAKLYQDMCSSAGIRCLTVDGYLKRDAAVIGEKDDEKNHMWNVVQLDISPTQWYYVDVALASGNFDSDMKVLTKSFSTQYFFPDKKIFNWQHYPDNMAWKLEAGPKSKSEFANLPVIQTASFTHGLQNFLPNTGIIKSKTNQPVKFTFTLSNTDTINKVTVKFIFKKKTTLKEVDYNLQGNKLSFNYKFDKDETMPISILVNNKELISYLAIIEDAE